jgi:murein DD-endopeptidase MepM/ murein hydrolase activator NlpD
MSSRRTGIAALVPAVAVAVAAVVTAGLLASPSAAYDPERKKRQVDASVRQLQEAVHESSAQLAAAERQFRLAEAQLPGAQAALAAAQQRLGVARARESELARKLHAVEVAEAATVANLQRVVESIALHQTTVGRIARRTYQHGSFAQLSVALQAQTPQELASRLAYVQVVLRSERNVLTKLGEDRAELAYQRARLEAVRRQVAERRAEAAEAVRQTQALEQQASAAADRVAALVDQRKAAVSAAERERAADLRRYQEMQAESGRLGQLIRAQLARERATAAAAARRAAAERAKSRSASSPSGRRLRDIGGSPGSGGSLLSYPVNGPITSPFGMRYHPILQYTKLHTGTDFGAPYGAAVRAARAGTVIQSYYHGAYGNRVVVNHGYVNGVNLVTTYNHLSRRSAFVGERLSRGEVLGAVGSTGYSTGPHLHFETLENGSFVNPMKWL